VYNSTADGGTVVKYKSQLDWWAHVFILAVNVVATVPMFLWFIWYINLPLYDIPQFVATISLTGLIVVVIVLGYFFRYYGSGRVYCVLEQEELYVKLRRFSSVKIPYRSIISAQLTNDTHARLRLGFTRNVIHIKHSEGSAYLSLQENHDFLEQLQAKQTGGVDV